MAIMNHTLKPIFKWVGGKRWLIPALDKIWRPYNDRKLVEPFTGGMAVALGLSPKYALLNDINPHLINLYNQVKKGLILNYRFKNNEAYFYNKRKRFNQLIESSQYKNQEAAAIFFYLIKTGFNGLCRFNNDGKFNVPFGQHKSINYDIDLDPYHKQFGDWQFNSKDFAKIKLTGDEFLYVDPPYDVEFTKYHKKDFNFADQIRLAEWLKNHKGPIIASNQATPRIIELYEDFGFSVKTLYAPRRVSCNGDRRPALEILAFKGIPKNIISRI